MISDSKAGEKGNGIDHLSPFQSTSELTQLFDLAAHFVYNIFAKRNFSSFLDIGSEAG